jgi:WD40 repeat protein
MSTRRSIWVAVVTGVAWGLAALAVPGCGDGSSPFGLATSVVLSSSTGSVPAGESFTVSATVRDGRGEPVADPAVTWKSSAPTIAAVVTAGSDSTGQAAAIVTGVSPGGATITATSGVTSARVFVTVGLARLSIALALSGSGDGQTATVGSLLPNPLRVVVRRRSAVVPGITVHWTTGSDTLVASHGSLSAASTTTDAGGVADVSWTLGHVAGSQSVVAWISDPQSLDSLVSFTAVANPGPATQLRFMIDPTNIFPGRLIRPAVRVVAVDAFNNPTSAGGSVSIALGGSAGATLSGTTSVALACDANGCGASFPDLSVDQVGTGFVLDASMSGLSGIPSAPFDVVAPGPGRIAFQSGRDGNSEIYSMNADGSGVVRLTVDQAIEGEPAWSPDGKKIALDYGISIYVMNAEGSAMARLADSVRYPAWSADGKRLVGSRGSRVCGRGCRVVFGRIFVMNADGSGLVVLTNGITPAWSPDGRIAFAYNGDIKVMNADGSGLIGVTNDSATFDVSPAWSPDGKKIAFVRGGGGTYDLYVMNADGTGVTQLTHDQATEGRPAWSSDATRIAYASDKDGDSEIYVINADGSGMIQLTFNSVFDGWPAWAP